MARERMTKEERLAYFNRLVTPDTKLMDLFDEMTILCGDGIFIKEYESGQTVTWNEMHRWTDTVAKGLIEYGIEKGDHVLIWGKNSVEWVVCFLACLKIGAISVLGNTANKESETAYLLKNGDIKMILMDEGLNSVRYEEVMENLCPGCLDRIWNGSGEFPFLQYIISFDTEKTDNRRISLADVEAAGTNITDKELAERAANVVASDIINIQYTSGTTGDPKGAMWDQRCLLYNLQGISTDVEMYRGDKLYTSIPIFHNFGLLGCIVFPIIYGITVVFSNKFKPEEFLRALYEERPAMTMGVTTMFLAMLSCPEFHAYDFSGYEMRIVLAGSLCPQRLLEALRNDFKTDKVIVLYGLTEAAASANTNMSDPLKQQLTSIGKASGGYTFRICDPVTRKPLPAGEEGEIAIKGIAVMRGYYKKPEETAKVLDEDGWFYTGDIACMDENGYVYISGRAKDMINRGGEKIYPKEVENFLLSHPAISDAQIVGVPSERYGEEVMAYIITKAGEVLTEEEVKEYVRAHMAVYKTPKYVRFIDSFPCTLSGKVQKYKLVERARKELGL